MFDLFAIIFKLEFWQKLIFWMYDITNPYWNILWLSFIIMGGLVLLLGIKILKNVIVKLQSVKEIQKWQN